MSVPTSKLLFSFKAGLRGIQGLGPKIREAMSGKIDDEEELDEKVKKSSKNDQPAEVLCLDSMMKNFLLFFVKIYN